MKKTSDKIYSAISYIGLLPSKMAQTFLAFLKKLPVRIFKLIKSFLRSTLSSKRLLVKRMIVFIAIIALSISAAVIIKLNSYKTDAVAILCNGEIIGYAASQTDADLAKANACALIDPELISDISYESIRTDACNVSDTNSLCNAITQAFESVSVEVSEIYIGNTFICAVDNPIGARSAINNFIDSAKKLYPDEAVSLSESIEIRPAVYSSAQNVLTSADLTEILYTQNTPSIQHTRCIEAIAYTDFETVEIQSNELFVGDSRVKRTGQNGAEYQVSLVKTVGETEVSSEHLMSVSVKEPVTQIVERGIRAENLIMDTYTVVQTLGVFCWPCVDLFEITSPYGERSLGYHEGIDISGSNAEGCLVVAGAGGTVTEAGYNYGGYGNYVIIDHGNGIETVYAHMLDNSLRVSAGDKIEKGEIIGQVGNTGYSFGAHLHFEVRINGIKVNPAPYLGLQS